MHGPTFAMLARISRASRSRFVSPVKAGAKIRMSAKIASITEVAGGVQLAVDQVIEVEGSEKPAVVAHSLYRFYE